MTREEVKHIKRTLEKIKNPDGEVVKAIAYCDKQLAVIKAIAYCDKQFAIYDSCKGQIKDNY